MRVIWKPGTHLTNICEIPILQCKYRVPMRNQDISVKEGEKEMTLKDVACGQTVKVTKLTGEGPVKRRIMDMGITRGAEIYVRKVAPLGDPMEVTVRGYELSLRKADTEMIEVE